MQEFTYVGLLFFQDFGDAFEGILNIGSVLKAEFPALENILGLSVVDVLNVIFQLFEIVVMEKCSLYLLKRLSHIGKIHAN